MRNLGNSTLNLRIKVHGSEDAVKRISGVSAFIKRMGRSGKNAAKGLGVAKRGIQSTFHQLEKFSHAMAAFFSL